MAGRPVVDELDVAAMPAGEVTSVWLRLVESCLGSPMCVPVLVAKGAHDGPVLGLTAAVHGDEVSGAAAIHTVVRELRPRLAELRGAVIGLPVVCVPAFRLRKRIFPDQSRDVDLNRIFPGDPKGSTAQQYAHAVLHKAIAGKMNYLFDLHTACFGNVNCMYLRADMNDPTMRKMALAMNADVLLHSTSATGGTEGSGTLRAAASAAGVHTVCVEMGNPSTFNEHYIQRCAHGAFFFMGSLAMLAPQLVESLVFEEDGAEPDAARATIARSRRLGYMCRASYWIFSAHGGLMTVHVELCERVQRGQRVATIINLFGEVVEEVTSPEDGVIIGHSENPTQDQGGRVIHLGVLAPPGSIPGVPEREGASAAVAK